MSINSFLIWWLMIGMLGVIARPRMIWQEENRAYRIMLLILTCPLGVCVRCGAVLLATVIAEYTFWKSTVNGVDPSTKEAK